MSEEDSKQLDLFNSPEWRELQEAYAKADSQFEQESEEAWNKLDADTKLLVFCAISRRIYKGELEDQGTYRHVLYKVFGFGPEAYAPAQLSGYLAIHNAIYGSNEREDLISRVKKFATENKIDQEKINQFIESELLY